MNDRSSLSSELNPCNQPALCGVAWHPAGDALPRECDGTAGFLSGPPSFDDGVANASATKVEADGSRSCVASSNIRALDDIFSSRVVMSSRAAVVTLRSARHGGQTVLTAQVWVGKDPRTGVTVPIAARIASQGRPVLWAGLGTLVAHRRGDWVEIATPGGDASPRDVLAASCDGRNWHVAGLAGHFPTQEESAALRAILKAYIGWSTLCGAEEIKVATASVVKGQLGILLATQSNNDTTSGR